jgi:hypothetical protein
VNRVLTVPVRSTSGRGLREIKEVDELRKRISLVLAVVAAMVMMTVTASWALAEPPPRYSCPPGSHGIQVQNPRGDIVGHCT